MFSSSFFSSPFLFNSTAFCRLSGVIFPASARKAKGIPCLLAAAPCGFNASFKAEGEVLRIEAACPASVSFIPCAKSLKPFVTTSGRTELTASETVSIPFPKTAKGMSVNIPRALAPPMST